MFRQKGIFIFSFFESVLFIVKIFNNTFCVYHFIRKSPRKILECSIIYESCRS